jgi:selenocysteine lyase/cysteine desulfurase
VSIDVDGVHALFSCSHKWLLGVRGIGHLYVAPELRDAFRPITPGWKATVEPALGFYGPELNLASAASKLDASSPWFDAIANAEGANIIEEMGIQAIERHNYSLVHYLAEAGIAVPFKPQNQSPIVSLDLPDPDKAMASLKAHNITAAVRAGRLRVAMHLYNTIDDMDAVIESVT